ncbi:MAG: Mbeg1-like protein [Pseudomonadota bacterium]
MASQFEKDCALIAGVAYRSTRENVNRFPSPIETGWSEIIDKYRSLPSGFEAVSFQRGKEIVISYAGTDPKSLGDLGTNANLAAGSPADQLVEAVQYYLDIKANNPPGTKITLTGHSLGGGLAALVGVFFGVDAVTFDQAPFLKSAASITTDIDSYEYLLILLRQQNVSEDLLQPLIEYVNNPEEQFAIRKENVSYINVQGEFLSTGAWTAFKRIGNQKLVLEHGSPDVDNFSLHSMALLTAFLQNNDFREISKDLPDMLRMVFDDKLYSFSTNKPSTDENFMERLVRYEFGNAPGAADCDMLGRFTEDMKI